MDLKVSQLDLLALGKRAMPKRIRELERRQRRSGIRTRPLPVTASTRPAMRGSNTEAASDPVERPLGTTAPFVYEEYSVAEVETPELIRPNLLRNGSFEFYQTGNLIPYAWAGTGITFEPTIPTMDGQYVVAFGAGEYVDQTLADCSALPGGSWVFSFWAYSADPNGSVGASFDATFSTVQPTFGSLYRITSLGPELSDGTIPDGGWHRYYVNLITAEPGDIYVYLENSNAGTIYVDAAKVEYQPGEVTFLEPTVYSPDATTSSTIVRELRADNIIAGTLSVGGSGSDDPVIYVYDDTDTLIASLGAPVSGYRGLNIMGEAGIKIQPGGTLEAGAVTLSDNGIAITVGDSNDGARAFRFKNVAEQTVAALYSSEFDFLGVNYATTLIRNQKHFPSRSATFASQSASDGNIYASMGVAGNNLGTANATIQARYDATSGLTLVELTANQLTLNGAALPQGAGTLTATTTNSVSGSAHTHAITAYDAPGATADRLIKTGTAGAISLADLTAAVFRIGASALTASTSGNIALGAGTLTGSTANDATVNGHTHAIDAYSAPGTTAGRIIKTGTSGAISLADLTASVFSLNGRILTASISGNIAISAGTLSGTSTNDDTLNGHTHAITAFDTPGANANRLIKTGTAGAVTLADLTATVFRIGANQLTASTTGNIALGAGTLTGATTNSSASAAHTHAVDAYSAPGATADRLIKTGTSGAVTLADLTATVFRIGAATLTASVSGNIALGAGTLSASSLNAATSSAHTHAITSSSTGTASTLVATDASGEIAANLKSNSVINHPGWTAPTLTNSWVNFGAPFTNAGYYKDITGRVWLRGLIKNGTINTAMLTLPSGYQPVAQHMAVVYSSSGVIRVDVATTGAVTSQGAPAGAYTYLSLDGINFMTV
jgi:hypothetical protein